MTQRELNKYIKLNLASANLEMVMSMLEDSDDLDLINIHVALEEQREKIVEKITELRGLF